MAQGFATLAAIQVSKENKNHPCVKPEFYMWPTQWESEKRANDMATIMNELSNVTL